MSDPSPDLLAANERLLALRAQLARPADAERESCHRQLDQQPGTQSAPDQPAATPAIPHAQSDQTGAQAETAVTRPTGCPTATSVPTVA